MSQFSNLTRSGQSCRRGHVALLFLACFVICLGCEGESVPPTPLVPDKIELNEELVALAKNHKHFDDFFSADTILVGKADFNVTLVQESAPPIYCHDVFVMPEKAIKGTFTNGLSVKFTYRERSETNPNIGSGVRCLMLIDGNDEIIAYFELVDEDMIKAAQIASAMRAPE